MGLVILSVLSEVFGTNLETCLETCPQVMSQGLETLDILLIGGCPVPRSKPPLLHKILCNLPPRRSNRVLPVIGSNRSRLHFVTN